MHRRDDPAGPIVDIAICEPQDAKARELEQRIPLRIALPIEITRVTDPSVDLDHNHRRVEHKVRDHGSPIREQHPDLALRSRKCRVFDEREKPALESGRRLARTQTGVDEIGVLPNACSTTAPDPISKTGDRIHMCRAIALRSIEYDLTPAQPTHASDIDERALNCGRRDAINDNALCCAHSESRPVHTNIIEVMTRAAGNRQLDTTRGEPIESMQHRRGPMRSNRGGSSEQACSHDIAVPAPRDTLIPVHTRRHE
ncbi:MAG TPA: hypothetical protein VF441_05095 [Acidimicrobiia bacterium]